MIKAICGNTDLMLCGGFYLTLVIICGSALFFLLMPVYMYINRKRLAKEEATAIWRYIQKHR
jgi:hypothetical protein